MHNNIISLIHFTLQATQKSSHTETSSISISVTVLHHTMILFETVLPSVSYISSCVIPLNTSIQL